MRTLTVPLRQLAGPAALVLALCCVLVAYVVLAIGNPHVGLLADDALYLLMADIYSPWRLAQGSVYEHVRTVSHLPPGLPIYLGLLGGGADDLVAARVACAIAMAGGCALAYVYGRRLGFTGVQASWVAFYVALTPSTLLYVIDVWSEGLYMALSLAALALAIREEGSSRPNTLRLVLLGLLVACAMATRSIGMALVPAVLWAVHRHGPRAFLVVAMTIGLGRAGFSLVSMGASSQSYGNLMRSTYGQDPWGSLTDQLTQLADTLPSAWSLVLMQLPNPAWWQALVMGGVGFLVVVGLARECLQRSPLAVYVLGYLGIVALWPFPDLLSRFLYPLLPVLLLLMLRGATGLPGERWVRLGMSLVLSFTMLGVASGFAARAFTPIPDPDLSDWRATRYWLDPSRGSDPMPGIRGRAAYVEAASLAGEIVPEGECLYAIPVHIAFFGSRRPAMRPPPPQVLGEGHQLPCRYFLAVADSIPGFPPFYPLGQLPGKSEVVAIVRVRGQSSAVGEEAVAAIILRWPADGGRTLPDQSGEPAL